MYKIGDEVRFWVPFLDNNDVFVNSIGTGDVGNQQLFRMRNGIFKVFKVEGSVVSIVATSVYNVNILDISLKHACFKTSDILDAICEKTYLLKKGPVKARSLAEEDITPELVELCNEIFTIGPVWLADKRAACGKIWDFDHVVEFVLKTKSTYNIDDMFEDKDGDICVITPDVIPNGYCPKWKPTVSAWVVPVFTIDTATDDILYHV